LDLEARHKILSFLKKEIVEDSKTLLLVSHIPEEVEYLCNRIILLDQGKLILDLPLDLVREKFQSVLNLMNLHFQGKLNT
jgi:ABC-2 type transport system ATP-binding protein